MTEENQSAAKRRRIELPEGEGAHNNDFSQCHTANSHPLLNDVVLERVFSFCGLELLPNIRTVCTLWRDLTLSRWRNEKTISIDMLPRQDWTSPRAKNLNYNDLMFRLHGDSFSVRPFKAYRLRNWIFTRYALPPPYLDILEVFIAQRGCWMRDLTLVNPEMQSVEAFYTAICDFMPNLTSLALIELKGTHNFCNKKDMGTHVFAQTNITFLKIIVDPRDVYPRLKKVPWSQLLMLFPNLQTLKVGNLGDGDITDLTAAMRTINSNESGPLKIKALNLFGTLLHQAEAKEILTIPHLQLEELHLNTQVHCGVTEISYNRQEGRYQAIVQIMQDISIIPLIQAQAPILRSLRLTTGTEPYFFANLLFQVPFEFLSKLRLHGNVVQSWDFLEHTPNLKSLWISNCEMKDLMMKPRSYGTIEALSVTLPHVEEFRVDIPLPLEAIKFFVKLMKNLKTLEAPLTDQTFGIVCINWKELKELHVINSASLGDEGITGYMAGAACQDRHANITDLKYLRSFSTSTTRLSDKSIWDGFLLLPDLDVLQVNFSSETSKEAINTIMMKFPNFRRLPASRTVNTFWR